MARGGPRECFLAREGKIVHLHPPPLGQEVSYVRGRELGHQGSSLARQDFLTFFLARRQKYLRSTGLHNTSWVRCR